MSMTSDLPIISSPATDINEVMVSDATCKNRSGSKFGRWRRKRRYYNIGMIARITTETTDCEIRHLMQNEVRTFLLSRGCAPKIQNDSNMSRTMELIKEYEAVNPFRQSLAFEFQGDGSYFGRIRNGCSLFYYRGDILTLTGMEQYKNSCYKEIGYASNLFYYITNLCLRDVIYIGDEVYGVIVKMMKHNVSLCVLQTGKIRSYDYISFPKKCYLTPTGTEFTMFEDDCLVAETIEADYVVVPRIRSRPYLYALRKYFSNNLHVKIIGILDYEFLMLVASQLKFYLRLLDILLIPDYFKTKGIHNAYIFSRVLPMAKQLNVPIIGKIPIESCCEFKNYENHKFLNYIEGYFLEKSEQCRKYPLVVKHLQPVKKAPNDNMNSPIDLTLPEDQLDAMLQYIVNIVGTMNCRLIIVATSHRHILKPLTQRKIYCPVYIMLPLEHPQDQDAFIINADTSRFARSLNLCRNLKAIVYDNSLNYQNLKPIEYGVELAQKRGVLHTCDLVVTLEEVQDTSNIEAPNVLMLRTLYLLPTNVKMPKGQD